MSRCFQVFNNNKPIQKFTYASDVIYNKKSIRQYSCVCLKQQCCCRYGIYNNSKLLNTYDLPFSKNSLNRNLYTKINLTDICTVKLNNPLTCPTTVDVNASVPFYYNYTIDPNGYLFGNSQCNINNYIKFLCYCKPE
jgi:hypothetical protein